MEDGSFSSIINLELNTDAFIFFAALSSAYLDMATKLSSLSDKEPDLSIQK